MAGWAIGLMMTSFYTDKRGRLKPFLRIIAIQPLAIIGIVFSIRNSNKAWTGFLLFLFGFSRCTMIIGQILIVETSPKHLHSLIVSIFNFIEQGTVLFWGLYFSIFKQGKFENLIIVVALFETVFVALAIIYGMESPSWLL